MAKKKNKDVVFRRIGGRIVPIRVKSPQKRAAMQRKKKSKKQSVGFGLVAAGIGVSAGISALAGKLARSAMKKEAKTIHKKLDLAKFAMAHGGLDDPKNQKLAEQFLRSAGKDRKRFVRKVGASKALFKFGGHTLGGAITGVGLERLIESGLGRELGAGEEILTDAAGVATAVAADKGFRAAFGKGMLLKVLSKGKL